MKNILITGGTGMVGGLVLRECLERNDVAQVTSVVRKPSGMKHAKLKEVVLADFLDPSPVADMLRGQDICFFCIGVYTGAVPKEEFRRITVDYTVKLASAIKANSPQVTFCFLSGDGADRSEKSSMMFARDKGAAENFLVGQKFARLHVFRPGYIYPVHPRKEPNTMYAVMRVLYKPVFSWLSPNIGVTSVQLAAAMVKVGFEGGVKEILENRDIRAVQL